MRLLLDTHVFVWSATQPGLLSPRAAGALGDPANDIFVSAVSAYEIEYKRSRDAQLQIMPAQLDEAVSLQGFCWLSINPVHAAAAAKLPDHHRDPWDRILLAQALDDDLMLVTIDTKLDAYGATILW